MSLVRLTQICTQVSPHTVQDAFFKINKTTVDTAKEQKINKNHYGRNEIYFKKKTYTMKERVLLLFYEIVDQ